MLREQIALIVLMLSAATMYQVPYAKEDAGINEYCQWETFNASCSPGEVILMETARYGRMQIGRCLTADYYVGCSADVLTHVDSTCSGRRRCLINVPDPILFNVQPCRKDLVAYFAAKYICIPVLTRTKKSSCENGLSVAMPESGYISSHTSEASSHDMCPWSITVEPGQNINFTLYDFSTWPRSTHSYSRNARLCNILATIREGDQLTEVRACNGFDRVSHVHTSTSNSVQVQMSSLTDLEDKPYFLLYYEAVGCAHLNPPLNSKMTRKGDVAVVRCNNTAKAWHLVCRGTHWMGDLGNCTGATPMKREQVPSGGSSFPYGIMLAIGIGVILGIVLGVALLMLVFGCHKKKRLQRRPERAGSCAFLAESGHYADPREEAYKLIEIRQQNFLKQGLPHPDDVLARSPRFGTLRAHCDHVYETTMLEQAQDGATIRLSRPDMLTCCQIEEKPLTFTETASVATLPPGTLHRVRTNDRGVSDASLIYGTTRRGFLLR